MKMKYKILNLNFKDQNKNIQNRCIFLIIQFKVKIKLFNNMKIIVEY